MSLPRRCCLLPAAALARHRFRPDQLRRSGLQVADDVQMVDQLYQEVTNEVAMVKSWNFTQLPGILQSMNVWQQVFGQAGTPTRPPIPAARSTANIHPIRPVTPT